MKKNLIILFLLMTGILSVKAQERVDAVLPKISSATKGKITDATGWILHDSGKWISRKNRIPWNTDVKLMDYEYYALGEERENFIYYDMRDVTIKDSVYTILIKKYKDGYYKYQSIQEGWTPHNSLKYYVFKADELKKLNNLAVDTNHSIKINTLYYGTIGYLDPKASFATVEADLNKVIEDNTQIGKKDLGLYLKLYKDKVRFVISDYETSDYFIPNLDKKYYEMTKIEFDKFIKL